MKLGIFPGTFNPAHKAHLAIVKYALKQFDFDKLLVIPAHNPPQKNIDKNIALHRFNLTKLLFSNLSKVEISDIEFRRDGNSYTYLTICELYSMYNIDGKIYCIIGTDAFANIENWYKSDDIKKLVKFLVFERESNFIQNKYDNLKNKGYDFEIMKLPFDDISSSNLRIMIRQGIDTKDYLSKQEKEYIRKYGLYKN